LAYDDYHQTAAQKGSLRIQEEEREQRRQRVIEQQMESRRQDIVRTNKNKRGRVKEN
jgi:hypothetical protein